MYRLSYPEVSLPNDNNGTMSSDGKKTDTDNPYERIEVREDGYLWLVNYVEDGSEDEQHQQPLVLHSVSTLLRQLKEPWHERIVMTDNVDDDDEEEEEEEEQQPQGQEPPKDKEEEKGKKEEEVVEDVPKEQDSSAKNVDKEFAHLARVANLQERINRALNHILQYKHETKRRKRNGNDRRQTKMIALQMQQERLLQQKQQRQQSQNSDEHDPAKDKDPEERNDTNEGFQVVTGKSVVIAKEKSSSDDGSESEESIPLHPHVRLIRTFNSIRALFPVLLNILFHPKRRMKSLKVGAKGASIASSKKSRVWLLGKHVFDICPERSMNSTVSIVQDLLELFLPYQLATDILKTPLTKRTDFWNREWPNHVWINNNNTGNDKVLSFLSPYDVIASLSTGKDTEAIIQHCLTCDNNLWPKHAHSTKESKQYDRAVQALYERLRVILEKDFPGSRLSVYGSCLSNLSLKASDVDLSLFLPQADRAKTSFQNGFWSPARYEREMSTLVRDVFRRLVRRQAEFDKMIPVTRARVPVVKGAFLKARNPHTPDGSLHFDICFLNDIAVANSSLLREYSLMHESVRELMIMVKQWAKEYNISSAQDNCISSYAWMNMVVFYLQCIDFVPNLQCPVLAEKVGIQRDATNYWHNVNDLDTFYLTYEQAKQVWKRPEHFDKQPISNVALLYGFFHFYASAFPRQQSMLSIKRGKGVYPPKTCFRKCSPFYCIEDPFELWDSHCPHDLGVPVNEVQCHNILAIIEETEQHLRKIVLGDVGLESLWPNAKQTDKEREHNKAGRGGQPEGGGGDGQNKDKKGKGRNKKNNVNNPTPTQPTKGKAQARQEPATESEKQAQQANGSQQTKPLAAKDKTQTHQSPAVDGNVEKKTKSGKVTKTDAKGGAEQTSISKGSASVATDLTSAVSDSFTQSAHPAPPTTTKDSASANRKKTHENKDEGPSERSAACTLVIRNLPRKVEDSDILDIFRPFAAEVGTRVVGITVVRRGNMAYVDYGTVDAVSKAINEHKDKPIYVKDKEVSLSRKIVEVQQPEKQTNGHGKGKKKKKGTGRPGPAREVDPGTNEAKGETSETKEPNNQPKKNR